MTPFTHHLKRVEKVSTLLATQNKNSYEGHVRGGGRGDASEPVRLSLLIMKLI